MLGRVTWGLGRRGGGRGGGVGGGAGSSVARIPRPKLIPERDGMSGAPGDA